MAIQLTAEQEQRIQAVVDAAPDFDGSEKELEGQLLKALESKEIAEEEFWDSIDRDTNAMLAARA